MVSGTWKIAVSVACSSIKHYNVGLDLEEQAEKEHNGS